jgi:hypothetical protein
MHFIVKGVRLFFTALLCCDLQTMSSIGNRAVTVLRRLVGNLVGTTFVPVEAELGDFIRLVARKK